MLPQEFLERMENMLGEEYPAFLKSYDIARYQALRLNPQKGDDVSFLNRGGFSLERVPWAEHGYYYTAKDTPGKHPYHEAGVYYIQEPSAMAPAAYLTRQMADGAGERILDLCAAPGGKSTQIAAAMEGRGTLISNEIHPARAKILSENIERMGIANAVVTNETPQRLAEHFSEYFTRIMVDAPCSGEGMFRKDTDSTSEWSVDNVRLCASRQRRIIHDIWNALKPGGILIYSTCTYNTEEDEENIHYIIEELGAEALPIPTQEEWQITGALRFEHPVYRFFPHKTRGEGFFLAALQKAEGEIEEIRVKSKGKKERGKAAPSIPQEARQFLSDETSFSLEWNDSFLRAYPKAHSDLFSLINAKPLRVLSAGICLGEAKGKDFIPSQELALSTALTPNAFPSVELEWENAIKFLKKEALVLPSGTDKGYVLVRYQGLPLGFAKNLGNRANNLYPQEWRIRTGYIPEEIKLFLGR